MKLHFNGPDGEHFALQTTHGKLVAVENKEVALRLIGKLPEADNGKPEKKRPRVPVADDEISPFFGKGPCFFTGCEELRASYRKELETLAKGGNCSDCDKGAVVRKYQERVRHAIAADKEREGEA